MSQSIETSPVADTSARVAKKWTTKALSKAGLFAALTAVSAQITIPLPPVPFTLQAMVSLLAGAVLGSRAGALSQAVYVVMGAIGLPVFAGRGGGFHFLVGPTGGYLIGFIFAAWIVGKVLERHEEATALRGALAMGLGLLAIYVPGALVLALHLSSLAAALTVGVIQFLPADILKAIVAFAVARGLRVRGIGGPSVS